jgi:hypothetical protein
MAIFSSPYDQRAMAIFTELHCGLNVSKPYLISPAHYTTID